MQSVQTSRTVAASLAVFPIVNRPVPFANTTFGLNPRRSTKALNLSAMASGSKLSMNRGSALQYTIWSGLIGSFSTEKAFSSAAYFAISLLHVNFTAALPSLSYSILSTGAIFAAVSVSVP